MSAKPSSTNVSGMENEQPKREQSEQIPASGEKSLPAANTQLSTEATSGGETSPATAQRSSTTSEKIDSLHSTVTIEDLGDEDSSNVTTSVSRTAAGVRADNVSSAGPPFNSSTGNNNNYNNNMALIPASQITGNASQMIPIALLRKSSTGTTTTTLLGSEECSSGTGLMQLITGNINKVAPAESTGCGNLEPVGGGGGGVSSATTVGAVLMLIPKRSDSVCVDIPGADVDNNRALETQTLEQQGDPNCTYPPNTPPVKPTQSYDSYEEVCRICHDNPSKMELISPCLCKGSMNKVHRACLERWLAESSKNSCEICNYEYNTVRKPKYKGCRSVYQWMRHPLSPTDIRNLFFDIACFFILTPLAAISSWLCVVGAQHYTFGEERRRRAKYHNEGSSLWDIRGHDARGDASNATWTSVGLLSLTGTLLVAYSVWLFVAIKYHIQAWKEWQQRNYTVTIVPFADGCMGRPPPPRPPRSHSNNNNNDRFPGGSGNDNGLSNNYNFDANPNLLRYSGHNSVTRGGGGRNLFRQNRQGRRNYNLPPIFSRHHFLRNPPPGYTISETTLLYQALYGTDSDAFLNENFLAFFADSSDEVTASSSQAMTEYQPPFNFAVTTGTPTDSFTPSEQRQPTPTEPTVVIVSSSNPTPDNTAPIPKEEPQSPSITPVVNNNTEILQNISGAATIAGMQPVTDGLEQEESSKSKRFPAQRDCDRAAGAVSIFSVEDEQNNDNVQKSKQQQEQKEMQN